MRLVMLLFVGTTACSTWTEDVSCPAGGCSSDEDCTSDMQCVFKMGSCAAVGQCMMRVFIGCNAEIEMCGCCGTPVYSGCAYPGGYASGPVDGDAGLSCLKP